MSSFSLNEFRNSFQRVHSATYKFHYICSKLGDWRFFHFNEHINMERSLLSELVCLSHYHQHPVLLLLISWIWERAIGGLFNVSKGNFFKKISPNKFQFFYSTVMAMTSSFLILVLFNESWWISTIFFSAWIIHYFEKVGLTYFEERIHEYILKCIYVMAAYATIGYITET